jgi:DNA-directed RNA polymerase subunit alpha
LSDLIYYGLIGGELAARRIEPPKTDSFHVRPGREIAVTRIPLNHVAGQAKDLQERLEMSTAEIGLTVRTTNCLEEKGIFTVNDLLHSTREDLLSISNFGEKTLEEVYVALEHIGFYRRERREAVMA